MIRCLSVCSGIEAWSCAVEGMDGYAVSALSEIEPFPCAVLAELLKVLKETKNEVICCFTVQEEVGLRGATTAAYRTQPDYGVAVDVTRTGDTPGATPMAVSVGKGPAVKVKGMSSET